MTTIHDYESWGLINLRLHESCLLEQYTGAAIVAWHGKIESQLVNLVDEADKARNFSYVDKLREYLKLWRENELTGSINRETIETLKGASSMLSVDTWNLSSYFQSLTTQLKVLLASEEQLPRGADMAQNEPFMGGGGGSGGIGADSGAPPMAPAFGTEKESAGGVSVGGTGMSSGTEPTTDIENEAPEGELKSEAGTPPPPGAEQPAADEEGTEGEELKPIKNRRTMAV